MSEAAQLYYIVQRRLEQAEARIAQLEEERKNNQLQIREMVANRKLNNRKRLVFIGLLSVTFFLVSTVTNDGIKADRNQILYVIEHVTSVIVSSSIAGLIVDKLSNNNN